MLRVTCAPFRRFFDRFPMAEDQLVSPSTSTIYLSHGDRFSESFVLHPMFRGSCTRQGIFRRQGCSGIFADIKSEYGRGRPWRR